MLLTLDVKAMTTAYAPLIVAGLMLIGMIAWLAYTLYGCRRKTRFVITDQYVEAFVYVLLLGIVCWMLYASRFWSTKLIKGLYR